MEEAPSGSCVDALDGELDALDGEPEGGAVNVENEMDRFRHAFVSDPRIFHVL